MALPWTTFFARVDTLIEGVWPEINPTAGGGGLYEYDDIYRTSQERIQADTGVPYASYQVPPTVDGNWGLGTDAHEIRLEVYYIGDYPTQRVGDVRQKLEDLKDAILAVGAFSMATCLGCVEMDWSGTNPAMSVFVGRHSQFVGGMVVFEFVLSQSIFR